MKAPKVHNNLPQVEQALIQAQLTVLIWGRGTGKSKPLALRAKLAAELMPRCIIRLGGYTYEGLRNNILPGIIETWEQDYGWIEGVHFWVNEWPPAHLGIKRPYYAPRGWGKHLISVHTGAAIMLTSMDRSIHNGSNFDVFIGDEARKSKQHRYNELLQAMRGNRKRFGDCWLHGSVMFATDRPQDAEGNWILAYKDLQDAALLQKIELGAYKLSRLRLRARKMRGNELEATKTLINIYEKQLNKLRKKAVHFSEASTLENIHALGIEFIMRTKRDGTPFEYKTAILNLPIDKVEDGFYALLDSSHEYHAPNYDYQDTVPNQHRGTAIPTWKWYNDYLVNEPLHIGFDHNHAINWVITGQPFPESHEVRIQSSHFVEKPDFVKQCVEKWCAFYKDYPCREVIYYFDATHVKGNAQGYESEKDTVINTLEENGWHVTTKYLGHPSLHNTRYFIWQSSLKGEDPRFLSPRFNAMTNDVLLKSMKLVGVKITEGQYKKDKDPEKKDKNKNYKVPPPLAPHGSEACDVVITGINRFRFRSEKAFIAAVTG